MLFLCQEHGWSRAHFPDTEAQRESGNPQLCFFIPKARFQISRCDFCIPCVNLTFSNTDAFFGDDH
jgi:hypothetical protein